MNARKANSLQRMIVITPEIFEKLSPFLSLTNSQDKFDSEMFNVLKNKKLNSIEKWYRYRQILHRQAELNRRSRRKPIKSLDGVKQNQFSQVGTQMRKVYYKDQDTNMSPAKITKSNTRATDQSLVWDNFNEQQIYSDDDNIIEVNERNKTIEPSIPEMQEIIFESQTDEENEGNKESDLTSLLPDEEFESLPNDIKQKIFKGNNLNRNSITGSDGAVYSFPDGYIERVSKPYAPKKTKTIKGKKPLEKTHTYLTRGLKKAQSEINFPTVKKLKWQGIP